MFEPKKLLYRKNHILKTGRVATSANKIDFGVYGIRSLVAFKMTKAQFEACRLCLSKFLKSKAKEGSFIFRCFPHFANTSKPLAVRMGSGKGSLNPDSYNAPISPGNVIIEISGVSFEQAKEMCSLAQNKISGKVKLSQRINIYNPYEKD